MSTFEEFKNAPVGATATRKDGLRATKTARLTWPWNTGGGTSADSVYMARAGYSLDQAPPATAREALDLAWELAHPVKEGQAIPAGTRCIQWHKGTNNWHIYDEVGDFETDAYALETIRTLDPLPEPEPDWLDAPAVLARLPHGWSPPGETVFIRTNGGTHWKRNGLLMHWTQLRDVTPLYPREDQS